MGQRVAIRAGRSLERARTAAGPGRAGRPSGAVRVLGPVARRRPAPGAPLAASARFRARTALGLLAGLLLAAACCADALAAERPRQVAGAIALDLAQLAGADGPRLTLRGSGLELAGSRVRFTARIRGIARLAGGRSSLLLGDDGGAELTLLLPAPLDAPDRLDREKVWEVIARPDRRERLPDGREAIVVGPDILVKTPAPPGEVHPGDVIVTVAGERLFEVPAVEPWVSEQPLYGLRVLRPGTGEFIRPAETAMAISRDRSGRRLIDYRQNALAADGRKRALRCLFRDQGGRLRNVAYGAVELSAAGEQLRHEWIDFTRDRYHDAWSARKKPFPESTYAVGCLGFALAGFPLGRARVMRFYVFSGRGSPSPLYAWVDGEETVRAQGREQRAVRVRVGLDVRRVGREIDLPEQWKRGAEAAGESFYHGDSLYWLARDPPHLVLRYRGSLGPPGAVEVELERLR